MNFVINLQDYIRYFNEYDKIFEIGHMHNVFGHMQ